MQKRFPFKIGADPEFNLFQNGENLNAKKTIKKLFRGKTEKGLGYEIERIGNIGWDSWENTAEIRPLPAYTPKELTENIRTLIKFIQNKKPEIEMSTKSYPDPVGGHLHFEIDKQTFADQKELNKIHDIMTIYYLAIKDCEDKENTKKRVNCIPRLKGPSTKIPTGITTYEFKLLNAEWLITPILTQATISIFATIFNEIRNHRNKIEKQTPMNKNLIEMIEQRKGGNLLMKGTMEKLKDNIRTFEYYPTFKKEIELIFEGERVMKKKKELNFNITNLW